MTLKFSIEVENLMVMLFYYLDAECKHCARMEDRQIEVTDMRRITVDPDPGWFNEELQKDHREDHDISPVIEWKERDEKPRDRKISATPKVI